MLHGILDAGMLSIAVPHGIMLPTDTLTSPWFLIFATVVAFNTIIYLGLTFAKLVPWPAQIHPARVRSLVPTATGRSRLRKGRTLMEEKSATLSAHKPDTFGTLRTQAALTSIPRALALLGLLIVAISLIVLVLDSARGTILPIVMVAFGVVLIGLAPVMSRPNVATSLVITTWVVAIIIFVLAMSWNAIGADSAIYLTYGVVGMTMLPAVAMSWRASLIGGAVCLPAMITAGAIVDVVRTPYWAVAAIAAYVVGLIGLQVRNATLDRLTIEQLRLEVLATRDPLTGLLTRTGLLTVAGTIAAAVEQADESVHVALVDVLDLREVNADYGFAFGDTVLVTIARSLRETLPEGDLVSRWSGHTFLILGVGAAPDPRALAERVESDLATSGVTLGKRPISIAASVAQGSPKSLTLEQLVAQASRPAPRS